MADFSRTPEVPSGIKALLEQYFDLMYTQDMALFDQVFHPESCLYSSQNDTELSIRPCAVYRSVMLNRESPASKNETRKEAVLMFDAISPTLALVKVQLQMFGGVMQDYLNLVQLDGKWWVMAKMWEKVGVAE